MSKFFQPDMLDSESSENESEQEEQEQVVQDTKTQQKPQHFYSSDESEEEKRVVISQKDKSTQQLEKTAESIKEKIKNKDFTALYNLYEELNSALVKAKVLVEKSGIPDSYLRSVIMLENFTGEFSNADMKKLNKNNQKSCQMLKQKVRKNNKQYEKQIKEFQDKLKQKQDEAKVKDEKKNEEKSTKKKKKRNKRKDSDEPEEKKTSGYKGRFAIDDDDIDEDDDEDQEDEDDDDQKFIKDNLDLSSVWEFSDKESEWEFSEGEELQEQEETHEDAADRIRHQNAKTPEERRFFWLKKKNTQEQKKKEKKKTKERKNIKVKEIDWDQIGVIQQREKKIFTPELALTTLTEIANSLIKNNKQQQEYLEDLNDIMDITTEPSKRLEVILLLLPTRYDVSRYQQPSHMPKYLWKESIENLKEYFETIQQIKISLDQENSSKSEEEKTDLTTIRTFKQDQTHYTLSQLQDIFLATFEILEQELERGFKNTIKNIEYAERIKNLYILLNFAHEVVNYLIQLNDQKKMKIIAFIIIKNQYYFHNDTLKSIQKQMESFNIKSKISFCNLDNVQETLNNLSIIIYKNGTQIEKIQTILYQCYNFAIHDQLTKARDFLLMSHTPNNIETYDVSVQCIYNRVIAQLGLAYFRNEQITECHNILQNLCAGSISEFLCQSIPMQAQKINTYRRRLLPLHLHINTTVVESIYYISAILLEATVFASNKSQKIIISKNFRKLYDFYSKTQGVFKPENPKDYIMAAFTSMKNGQWSNAYEKLLAIQELKEFFASDSLKNLLLRKVKEESLKCYLLQYHSYFETISLMKLSEIFELDIPQIKKIVCSIIYNRQLNALLDDQKQCIFMKTTNTTSMQIIASNLVQKLYDQVYTNESIIDKKFGSYGFIEKEGETQEQHKQKIFKLSKSRGYINQQQQQFRFKGKKKKRRNF